MSKITPNNLKKLIAKGRVKPILQSDEKGQYFLYGYKRTSNRSSKSHENYIFAEPIPLDKKEVDSNKQ
jgi:hypothetical protein